MISPKEKRAVIRFVSYTYLHDAKNKNYADPTFWTKDWEGMVGILGARRRSCDLKKSRNEEKGHFHRFQLREQSNTEVGGDNIILPFLRDAVRNCGE